MLNRIDYIKSILNDKKAEDIQVYDMKEKNYFVDAVIIATTLGDRHGYALLDYLKEGLRTKKESILNVESSPEWIVIDLGDVLIHLLTPEYRKKYNLEEFLTAHGKNRENNN